MTLPKAVKEICVRQGQETLIQQPMRTLPHILLIDDDEIFIFLTKKMFQSLGIVESISVCRSAFEAIELLHTSENWPNLILLDLNMPEMNGWEFLQHYQSLLHNIENPPKLFVVSSSIAENDTERAKKIKGVDGYIAKPLTGNGIRQMIKKAMD